MDFEILETRKKNDNDKIRVKKITRTNFFNTLLYFQKKLISYI